MQLGSTRQSLLSERCSRAAGSRPFKNGFRNHDWSSTLALRASGARLEWARILVSYRPLVIKGAVSAGAELLVAPSHSELSLWLITDLSRTHTPTLFTTPRKDAPDMKSKLSLPARPARLVAEYWLHAGFYLSPPPPPAKCDRKGGGRRKKKAGKKKK